MAKKQNTDNGLRDLKQALKEKAPGRLYFFYGEETFLLTYHLDRLKKLILDPVTESFNFHRFTEETWSITDFSDAVEMLPMMAEKTMVQVDDVELFKLPEDERNRLSEIFRDLPAYCTVVFTYITAPWKPDKRMRKLWEAMDSSGLVVVLPASMWAIIPIFLVFSSGKLLGIGYILPSALFFIVI